MIHPIKLLHRAVSYNSSLGRSLVRVSSPALLGRREIRVPSVCNAKPSTVGLLSKDDENFARVAHRFCRAGQREGHAEVGAHEGGVAVPVEIDEVELESRERRRLLKELSNGIAALNGTLAVDCAVDLMPTLSGIAKGEQRPGGFQVVY